MIVMARMAGYFVRGGGGVGRWCHESEDIVQRDGAYECETVDVAEVHFSAKEEESAEEEEEEDWAREVGVVHYVLVDASKGVKYC